jgi:uncharacterized membrane protein
MFAPSYGCIPTPGVHVITLIRIYPVSNGDSKVAVASSLCRSVFAYRTDCCSFSVAADDRAGKCYKYHHSKNTKYHYFFLHSLVGGCFISLIVAWILLILGTLYLRKSYNSIAEHTKVDLFKTTGLVYFIGALTLIVVIGVFIIIIAKILEIVSYFSLPENLPSSAEIPKTETTEPV